MGGLIGPDTQPNKNLNLTFNTEAACTPLSGGETLPVESLSELTLYPAPGEQFDIEVNVVDELMNLAEVTVAVQVRKNRQMRDSSLLQIDSKTRRY